MRPKERPLSTEFCAAKKVIATESATDANGFEAESVTVERLEEFRTVPTFSAVSQFLGPGTRRSP